MKHTRHNTTTGHPATARTSGGSGNMPPAAACRLSNKRPLRVLTMNLWNFSEPCECERQAVEIVKLVRRHASADEFPPIIAGDFDATPEEANVRFLASRQSLEGLSTCFRDAWAEAGDGGPGHTWTTENRQAGHLIETILFEKRHAQRIDYIFMGSFHDYPKFARISTYRVVMDKPTNGIWPSDHYAVYATIDVMPSPP